MRQEPSDLCGIAATALEVILDLWEKVSASYDTCSWNMRTFGSVPLVLRHGTGDQKQAVWGRLQTYLVVRVVFVPRSTDSARNWTIWPDESGSAGL